MITENPLYKKLDETYFQGEYVYNYGGWVPAIIFSGSPNPTPSITPSITPTNTITPSITPSPTPQYICPTELELTYSGSVSTLPQYNGVYSRVYNLSGITTNYGWLLIVGATASWQTTQYNGLDYPIYQRYDGTYYWTLSYYVSGSFETWVITKSSQDYTQDTSTAVGASSGMGKVILGGVAYPQNPMTIGSDFWIVDYTNPCPTPTPTPTPSITPTLTPTLTTNPPI